MFELAKNIMELTETSKTSMQAQLGIAMQKWLVNSILGIIVLSIPWRSEDGL